MTAKVEGRHDSTKVECGYEIETETETEGGYDT